jgi:hypothetical protein
MVRVVRMQVDALEALEHLKWEPRLVELADGVVEVEFLQHLRNRMCQRSSKAAISCRRPTSARSPASGRLAEE